MLPARRPALLALALVSAALAGCFHAPEPGPIPAGVEPDADRLLELVRAQLVGSDGAPRFRVPGTLGNAETARWIGDTLGATGATVRVQSFRAEYRCDGEVDMRNVVGTLPGRTNETVYLGAHFDTRPVADKDPEPGRRSLPVPGANDGGSGVAVVLELARLLAKIPDRRLTYVFVLFDGEDGGKAGPADNACDGEWILGSRHFVRTLGEAEVEAARAMLLFDMVGDRNLTLRKEGNTAQGPGRAMQERLWRLGAELGHASIFLNLTSFAVTDDHLPFLDRGIPAIDLIHLDGGIDPFPETHHTTADDMQHVSKDSLRAVARTALAWLVEQERAR